MYEKLQTIFRELHQQGKAVYLAEEEHLFCVSKKPTALVHNVFPVDISRIYKMPYVFDDNTILLKAVIHSLTRGNTHVKGVYAQRVYDLMQIYSESLTKMFSGKNGYDETLYLKPFDFSRWLEHQFFIYLKTDYYLTNHSPISNNDAFRNWFKETLKELTGWDSTKASIKKINESIRKRFLSWNEESYDKLIKLPKSPVKQILRWVESAIISHYLNKLLFRKHDRKLIFTIPEINCDTNSSKLCTTPIVLRISRSAPSVQKLYDFKIDPNSPNESINILAHIYFESATVDHWQLTHCSSSQKKDIINNHKYWVYLEDLYDWISLLPGSKENEKEIFRSVKRTKFITENSYNPNGKTNVRKNLYFAKNMGLKFSFGLNNYFKSTLTSDEIEMLYQVPMIDQPTGKQIREEFKKELSFSQLTNSKQGLTFLTSHYWKKLTKKLSLESDNMYIPVKILLQWLGETKPLEANYLEVKETNNPLQDNKTAEDWIQNESKEINKRLTAPDVDVPTRIKALALEYFREIKNTKEYLITALILRDFFVVHEDGLIEILLDQSCLVLLNKQDQQKKKTNRKNVPNENIKIVTGYKGANITGIKQDIANRHARVMLKVIKVWPINPDPDDTDKILMWFEYLHEEFFEEIYITYEELKNFFSDSTIPKITRELIGELARKCAAIRKSEHTKSIHNERFNVFHNTIYNSAVKSQNNRYQRKVKKNLDELSNKFQIDLSEIKEEFSNCKEFRELLRKFSLNPNVGLDHGDCQNVFYDFIVHHYEGNSNKTSRCQNDR